MVYFFSDHVVLKKFIPRSVAVRHVVQNLRGNISEHSQKRPPCLSFHFTRVQLFFFFSLSLDFYPLEWNFIWEFQSQYFVLICPKSSSPKYLLTLKSHRVSWAGDSQTHFVAPCKQVLVDTLMETMSGILKLGARDTNHPKVLWYRATKWVGLPSIPPTSHEEILTSTGIITVSAHALTIFTFSSGFIFDL